MEINDIQIGDKFREPNKAVEKAYAMVIEKCETDNKIKIQYFLGKKIIGKPIWMTFGKKPLIEKWRYYAGESYDLVDELIKRHEQRKFE